MEIDLTKYKLVQPANIKKVKSKTPRTFYDITVDEDNTFHVCLPNGMYLSHNCDGGHIFTLLVNFFYKWFPYIIEEGRLHLLQIPLMSVEETKNNRRYFYDTKEFDDFAKNKKQIKELRYLKGLGSLDIKDWDNVMNNKKLTQITMGVDADRYMKMAFDKDSAGRKKWLTGQFD